MRPGAPARARRPNFVDLLGSVAAAWGAFMVIGLAASLVVSMWLDVGLLLWPLLVAVASAIPAAMAVLFLAPAMFLVARRLTRPMSWLPLAGAATIGGGVAIIAVIWILSGGVVHLGVLQTGFLISALCSYGIAGALGGVVGWLVLVRGAPTQRAARVSP